ncbi:MAG: hypothetical protein ACRCT1_15690, partial [Microcoleaceae cyanobacterium]
MFFGTITAFHSDFGDWVDFLPILHSSPSARVNPTYTRFCAHHPVLVSTQPTRDRVGFWGCWVDFLPILPSLPRAGVNPTYTR